MSLRAAELLKRASDWLVEPLHEDEPVLTVPGLMVVPPRSYPLIAVVGLAPRCGATTIARALGAELAAREGGAAVVGCSGRPLAVALGSTGPAVQLASTLGGLDHVRPAGRLCLVSCPDAGSLASATRNLAPAVVEIEPGAAAVQAAKEVDRVVLVASPEVPPPLAGAVAETLQAAGSPPVLAVNRAPGDGPWLMRADVLIPDSKVGARLALSGREARGWLGKSVEQLADLCADG